MSGERRKRLDEARTVRFFELLGALPIVIDHGTADRAFGATAQLARAHNLSAYDAAYLELAIRLGLPLACLDGMLKAAASEVGVPMLVIEASPGPKPESSSGPTSAPNAPGTPPPQIT